MVARCLLLVTSLKITPKTSSRSRPPGSVPRLPLVSWWVGCPCFFYIPASNKAASSALHGGRSSRTRTAGGLRRRPHTRGAASAGRPWGGGDDAVFRGVVLCRTVWRSSNKSPWPNGCSVPCFAKTKKALLTLRGVQTSPGEPNVRSECAAHDLTVTSYTTSDRT